MPVASEIPISYTPGAKDGFRLGLLEDHGQNFTKANDIVQI